jgi:hypothetical protein
LVREAINKTSYAPLFRVVTLWLLVRAKRWREIASSYQQDAMMVYDEAPLPRL